MFVRRTIVAAVLVGLCIALLMGRLLYLQVDSHQQDVTLRGWVRTQDIDGRNIVEGWRLADLEILYASNGELIKPTKGLLQRLLGIVF